jgi:serine/threonine protein kinase
MTRAADEAEPQVPAAQLFANRYELHELLGRGGMASVHRAVDLRLGRQVALKQLTLDPLASEHSHIGALFEREFHTLVQLRHPRVIEVYDYGLGPDGNPFYTMELLDGGDLRESAPVRWRELSKLAFDVCSALALLHSRRLLHRDISPRNVRRTQAGEAKLIDFGALAPMGVGGADVVGTPAFTAPEVLQRLALDARTDLYSLGVTLYYALTGRLPYTARTFSDLLASWTIKPVAPSTFVAEIPPALDDLVLALINVEPELRPASAFDVMQRLAACAGLRLEESEAVSRAYLATPMLVARTQELATFREQLRNSRLRRTAGVLIVAPPGSGRSRLLDACTLDAQTHGFTVLRATASGSQHAFATASRLANHLLDSLPLGAMAADFPELFASPQSENDNQERPVLRDLGQLEATHVQKHLRRLLVRVSRTHALLIAVDDVHKIDEPSAALLAELIDKTNRGGMLIALTADREEPQTDALQALARRCSVLALQPLAPDETRELLASLFGDTANLDMLSGELHRIARGNPRQTLELAQHLVDRGLIRYTSGQWILPDKLSADDLPQSAAATMQARVARFSPQARFLAEAQALAFDAEFSDQDYRAVVPAASSSEIELALSELLEAQALLCDGTVYRLANRVWSAAFLAGLDAEQTKLRHRALLEMYAAKKSWGFIHHAFAAGDDERGLIGVEQRNSKERTSDEMLKLVQRDGGRLVWCYAPAIVAAKRLGRSRRDVAELRRWQYQGTVVVRTTPDRASAQLYFEQVSHDAGLDLYRSDTQSTTPQERLTKALQGAHARWLATPEHERVYPVDEAIRRLCEYAVIAIVEGARALDIELLRSLAGIVEPYAPLSPLIEAIWLNLLGTRASHCECRNQRALEVWLESLKKLDALGQSTESFVVPMRNAIMFAVGTGQAQFGLASASDWADRLDSDVFQRVSALGLRKIVRLEQGDADGAERARRQAEILSLQLRTPSMFHSSLMLEVFAYANSRHLAGLTQCIEQLRVISAQHHRWIPVLLNAEGYFEFVRGDYAAARVHFERSSELTQPDTNGNSELLSIWLGSRAGLAECLLALGHWEDARTSASAVLAVCEAHEIDALSFEIRRLLGLAEGKLGDARGAERLDALIAEQNALGVTGLRMGLSYEARARVAIWSGDAAAFERFAELTAREYRHGARGPLAARYELLMNEAARGGMRSKVSLADFEALAAADDSALGRDELLTIVTRSMAGHRSSEERTLMALQMICAAYGAQAGHLFLLTPAGPVLRASQGGAGPSTELAEHVSSFIVKKQGQYSELDDMVTGELTSEAEQSATERLAGSSYELLLLGCVIGTTSTLAGVAAVEVGDTRARNERQSQLLSALARSLLQAGDSQGIAS